MKAEHLTPNHFDTIFLDILHDKQDWEHQRGRIFGSFTVIATRDIASKLWQKHRVPIRQQAPLIRQKMRQWWNTYPWLYTPRPHKMICGVAVHLSSPMNYDYCMLEKIGLVGKSLITVLDNQQAYKELKK